VKVRIGAAAQEPGGMGDVNLAKVFAEAMAQAGDVPGKVSIGRVWRSHVGKLQFLSEVSNGKIWPWGGFWRKVLSRKAAMAVRLFDQWRIHEK
jgi:hypothetical protein